MKNLVNFPSKPNFFIFLVVLSICYAYSNYIRFEQYAEWRESPSEYFVGQTPMMSTLDSFIWLRSARQFNEGGIRGEQSSFRFFPDSTGSWRSVPLISYLIALVAPQFDYDYYRAALFLMIPLSGLFIFPLGVYCYLIGHPIAGILGGLIGTVSYEYFIRTSIGRVDTDALILFFLFLISALLLKASQTRKIYHGLIYSSLGGVATYCLTLWLGRPTYVLPFTAVVFVVIFLGQKRCRTSIIDPLRSALIVPRAPILNNLLMSMFSTILFLLFAVGFNLSHSSRIELVDSVTSFYGKYVQPSNEILMLRNDVVSPKNDFQIDNVGFSTSPKNDLQITNVEPSNQNKIAVGLDISFPNVLQTVKETRQFSIEKVLSHQLTSPILSAIGLIGCVVFLMIYWRKSIAILPIFALGLWTFEGARRFGIFLGPFVGIGYGFLLAFFILFMTRHIHKFRDKTAQSGRLSTRSGSVFNYVTESNQLGTFAGYGLVVLVSLYLLQNSPTRYTPKPSVPVPNFLSFLELGDMLPANAAMYTWWDYGYALTEITNRITFHDGGSQHTPKTYFIARSLSSDSPRRLYNTISYLASEGLGGLNRLAQEKRTIDEFLSSVLASPPILTKHPVFLVFTKDLIQKFRSIFSIGQWDFENKRFGSRNGYNSLNCEQFRDRVLICDDSVIDLQNAPLVNGMLIKETVIIEGGYVQERIPNENRQGNYLQVLIDGHDVITAHVIDDEIYNSNFNQMYLLGEYDTNLFGEYYNSFPWTRVFRVKKSRQPAIFEGVQKKEYLEKLEITRECKYCDLRGADLELADLGLVVLSGSNLSGVDLRGANLYQADLAGADLRGANLYRTNLAEADLTGANLYQADLFEANLRGANLHQAIFAEADLTGANLYQDNLSEAELSGAILAEALFRDPTLVGTVKSSTDLRETLLENIERNKVFEDVDAIRPNKLIIPLAVEQSHQHPVLRSSSSTPPRVPFSLFLPTNAMTEVNLFRGNGCVNCDLHGINLSGRYLNGFNFWGSNLAKANLNQAYVLNANLYGTNFHAADLSESDFSRSNLSNASLKDAILNDTKFIEANLTGVDLSQTTIEGSDLRRARLTGLSLTDTNLDHVELTGADLSFANFSNIDLSGKDLTGTSFRNSTLVNVNFTDTILRQVDFGGATLQGTDLDSADLQGARLTGLSLTDTNLDHVELTGADLSFANFSNIDLSGKDLTGTSFEYARFCDIALGNIDPTTSNLLTRTHLKTWQIDNVFSRRLRIRHTNLKGASCWSM